MQFTTAVSTLLFAGAVLAQESAVDSAAPTVETAAGSTEAPADGQVNVQVVKVGNAAGDTVFEPSNLQAEPGSMVQFQFWPKNHSVVQSTFDQPCMPINFNNASAVGLYSGFMPVDESSTEMPTYTIMVNDTKPIWLYCSKESHCQGGMAMAINAPTEGERTIEAYKQLAAAAPNNLSPGQMPSAGNVTGSASPSGGLGGGVGGGSDSGSGDSGSGASPPAPTASAPAAGSVETAGAATLYAGSSLALATFLSAILLAL